MRTILLLIQKNLCVIAVLFAAPAIAQYDPPAGQPGSLAMYKDSTAFVNWANFCDVQYGWQDISNTSLGPAAAGDSSMAIGPAGTNGTVSLGDSGIAILTFPQPIGNGLGPDFAIFENSFSDSFLELAFVEVSSDGENFFRFPAFSNTQDTAQVNSFGAIDATQLHNLAGKYRANYGTPFDLDDLQSTPGLDITQVTHVKIIDVVGSIQPQYATHDSQGHKVNDPWPTAFPSSGFDLDAVGVIHENPASVPSMTTSEIRLYPNPVAQGQTMHVQKEPRDWLYLYDASGRLMLAQQDAQVSTASFPAGFYMLTLVSENTIARQKILIR